ncbi:coronin-2B-like [Sinocyclocheilus anshuiensis]|uniref:coronin-2B-like n=1 Tax=Sinocyclocheilus anshuiensis TaxID=1608454 RepID=UPI0007B9B183|nr:PREDICTED: coronin-2B-like [Sinocyclocheilus anshuiensis]
MTVTKMSWRPTYRSSKFRNVYGKVANREHCFEGIPITKNVHDNHFCAVNARFLAIVTESAGGGSFVVIPVTQFGRIDPHYPKVCGHQGNVLDIKWNPFHENIIASCSEDSSVRIWEIPDGGLRRNLTESVLELYGHSRRVGLIEWHPTTSGILFSAGYDYKVIQSFLQGDGNIRYYEITLEKPYLQYLMEFRSPAPQKGLGVMPKHGLDVGACEVFRFYKLVTLKGLIEPISMIVPRRSETYQEDIYPMTPGTEPALSADEWLSGINRGPVLMSLKEGYNRANKLVFKAPVKDKKGGVVNGIDLLENVPPRTENELLRMFFRQQEELRRLKDEVTQKDIKIRQLELELNNIRNSPNINNNNNSSSNGSSI